MSQPNDIREIIELCSEVEKVMDGKTLTLQMDVYANMIAALAASATTVGVRPQEVAHAIHKNALRFIRTNLAETGVKIPRH